MADLSKDEIKSLGRAVGLDIAEPLLTEVTYNLNALKDLLEEHHPSGARSGRTSAYCPSA